MKKFLTALSIILVCAMLPVVALAISQTEWDQQCTLKMKSSAKTYDIDEDSLLATTTDLPLKVVGSIDAGTYVKRYDTNDGMMQIGYLSGGSERIVWVPSSAVTMAVAYVEFDDGTTADVPEALLNDRSALYKYLSGKFPGYSFSGIEGSSVIHKEKSKITSTAEEREEWHRLQDNAKDAAADLGVDMDELDNALVYAPRTGQASLREKASTKGKVIEKYNDGTIVGVVEKGKSFTYVLVNGKAGYILNSALEFLDPEQKPIGEGVISYNGKTTGKRTINVRCDGGSKARKIDAWRVGTEVVIWSIIEDKSTNWYEIEANNARLYIEEKYVTVTELYEDEEEEADEAAEYADDEADEDESYDEEA